MRRQRQAAFSVAYTALLAALSLVILYGSCLIPTGRAGVVGLAGLLPAAAVISGGPSSGVLCYAGTGTEYVSCCCKYAKSNAIEVEVCE